MAMTFPALRTSAIAQYPFQSRTTYSTEILRFVDGSEQRYSNYGQPVRRWVIQLDRVDEGELSAIRQFFRAQGGMAGRFAFADPVTGTAYANCSFDQQALDGGVTDINRGGATLMIRTNGQ